MVLTGSGHMLTIGDDVYHPRFGFGELVYQKDYIAKVVFDNHLTRGYIPVSILCLEPLL